MQRLSIRQPIFVCLCLVSETELFLHSFACCEGGLRRRKIGGSYAICRVFYPVKKKPKRGCASLRSAVCRRPTNQTQPNDQTNRKYERKLEKKKFHKMREEEELSSCVFCRSRSLSPLALLKISRFLRRASRHRLDQKAFVGQRRTRRRVKQKKQKQTRKETMNAVQRSSTARLLSIIRIVV